MEPSPLPALKRPVHGQSPTNPDPVLSDDAAPADDSAGVTPPTRPVIRRRVSSKPKPQAPSIQPSTVPQVVGAVNRGSLRNATALPWETPYLLKLYRKVVLNKKTGAIKGERRYGARELVHLLLWAAQTLRRQFPYGERLQVADLSDRDGGFLSPHKSHRTGRDADVLYLRRDHKELAPDQRLDAAGRMRERLANGVLRTTNNFDVKRNWELMKILARSGLVRYIFVNGVIKEEFCDYAKNVGELDSEEETLRLIRKIKGHTGHFHLRIKCPPLSYGCKDQGVPPQGTGCGSGTYEHEDFEWSHMVNEGDEEDSL